MKKKNNIIWKLIGILIVLAIIVSSSIFFFGKKHVNSSAIFHSSDKVATYTPSKEEKEYLKNKFSGLQSTNADTIAYIYAPGTQLDEPVMQTTDNYTYLTKTFEGENIPYLGAVFMDPDNKKDFSSELTWLFGHARGSQVADHRMFNDVNYYSDQSFFNEHPYIVVETPKRKFYYEAVAMVIVPETTAFYRTEFKDKKDFKTQLDAIYDLASVKNNNIKINKDDKYMVLSTCREEDQTIRANLYVRQIPDKEMKEFVSKHKDQLEYKATR